MSEAQGKLLRYLSLLAFLVALGASTAFVKWSDLDPVRTAGLIAFLALFEAWRVQFPWGRPLRLGMAALLCILAIRPVPEAVWIFLVGSLLGRVFYRVQRAEEGDFAHIIQRTYIVAVAGLVYRLIAFLGWEYSWNPYPPHFVLEATPEKVYFTYYNPVVMHRDLLFPVAFLAMALVFYLGEMATAAVETSISDRVSWKAVLPQHVRQTLPVYLSITGAGALMALYFPRIPWISFLVFFIPLLLVRAESNRDKELDDRFFQTMRIIGDSFDLSRGIPGHSGRVANLAVEVAREMGVSARDIRDIRYACVLHDIGRIEGKDAEEGEHAARGAEVLEQVPRLRSLSHLVRHHHPASEEGATRLPLGARIIGVVSDYDVMTNHPKRRLSSQEALEEMGLERGHKYDSMVLRTLSQVVEAQGRARRRPEREIRQRAKVLEEEELKESLEEIFGEEEQQG
ncbi:MAG: HD domain-containing protein [Actinobacteria bacterium]|nr:HD domain-containing protein [Actinomycetota bacterium]